MFLDFRDVAEIVFLVAFIALTLLVGWLEGHAACEKPEYWY